MTAKLDQYQTSCLSILWELWCENLWMKKLLVPKMTYFSDSQYITMLKYCVEPQKFWIWGSRTLSLKNLVWTQDVTSLLDDIVRHSCRTWSNTAAAGHYTHHEASHNLELIPESKEKKQLGLYLTSPQESMNAWDETEQEYELKLGYPRLRQ